jgi:hypothetical protein
VEELSKKQSEGDIFYEKVYGLYNSGNHYEALNSINDGLIRFKGTQLEPKLTLLSALCYGKASDLRNFKVNLEKVTKDFPKTEEAKVAQDMITYLEQRELQLVADQSANAGVATDTTNQVASAVSYSKPTGEHMFVLLVPKKSNINQLKFNIVSFNVDYFIETDLQVNNQPLNDFVEIISVSGFKDENIAAKYFNLISKNDRVFNLVRKEDYQTFVISIENFALFINDKSVADYLNFFKSNYSIEN